jgi:crossover junction endodeoxyribonuclease RusA
MRHTVHNRQFRFTVYGRPQPAGSKRAFAVKQGGVPTGRIAVTDDNTKGKPWRDSIVAEALLQYHATLGVPVERRHELMRGPLTLHVDFYVARPKGHYGSGRNAERVKPSAPDYPTTKPDVTKLVRAVEDALTGTVWHDDAQIVNQHATKRFDTPERCEISVTQL